MSRGCHSSGRRLGWLISCLLLSCACVNHYTVHPRTAPPSVHAWSEQIQRGVLSVRLEWAAPVDGASLPTVLVHPEAGSVASDMRGIIWDLAAHGYLAVAADYQRLVGGRYRRTLLPWREAGDPAIIMTILRANPRVDADRIGLVGFSQGGVFSLIIAAQDPGVRAVVAYYPVTDFPSWLNDPTYGAGRRFIFWFIRRRFRKDSGTRSDEEFQRMLERASPLRQADSITAPVLLIHGTKDRTAPVEQSRKLVQTLADMNRSARLVEVRDAGHVFNFYDRHAAQARMAWQSALAFLDQHVRR